MLGNTPAGTIKFVIRYVGRDPRVGKDITVEESQDLQAAGLARVIVYQPRQAFVPTWEDDGVQAAEVALEQVEACGMPSDRPIYFAVDGDTRTFTAAQWEPIHRFFTDVHTKLGLRRTGVYGGKNTVEHLRDMSLATWLWQTYAWSSGQWADVHLRQYDNGNSLCGGEVDFDQAMKLDYGQW